MECFCIINACLLWSLELFQPALEFLAMYVETGAGWYTVIILIVQDCE